MNDREYTALKAEATRSLNATLKRKRGSLPYGNLKRIFGSYLANAETRRLVTAEARKRGYRMTAFACR